jgi:hypothetical protein
VDSATEANERDKVLASIPVLTDSLERFPRLCEPVTVLSDRAVNQHNVAE